MVEASITFRERTLAFALSCVYMAMCLSVESSCCTEGVVDRDSKSWDAPVAVSCKDNNSATPVGSYKSSPRSAATRSRVRAHDPTYADDFRLIHAKTCQLHRQRSLFPLIFRETRYPQNLCDHALKVLVKPF